VSDVDFALKEVQSSGASSSISATTTTTTSTTPVPTPEPEVEVEVSTPVVELPETPTPAVSNDQCDVLVAEYEAQQECYYNDGTFSSDQWSDIGVSDSEGAIVNLTEACYYHGPNDTQALFKPTTDAKNAELVKIAVRMSRTLPQTFNHFAVADEDWMVPYYDQAEALGWLDGLALVNE